ncbi:thioredoxin family protein [Synechocystis sp. PCC 7509]|uniref:thioredoxin family protein n=1 Tax=Synechocystis sp. PCC 7509 TaxID=927677 RepID=UPI0002AD1271|nr:thioredoxin family protein [Synechocystis sp. PCC 7509]
MALTTSTMLLLGTKAPVFKLPDVLSGQLISLTDYTKKQAILVMFICQHCPFVKHIKTQLAQLSSDYANSNLGVIAISSNDVSNHPDDAPEYLQAMAQELSLTFPICYDESQEIAKAYTAACTPDFFLFDANQQLVYRGQLDDSRPSNGKPVNGKDLRAAIEAVLAGKAVDGEQKPSVGCNIKWKPGNAPSYYG